MKKIFQEELIAKQVDPSLALFNDISNTISSISDVQKSFACSLYDKQEEINRIMIDEAASYMSISSLSSKVVHVSRLPGTCVSLCLSNISNRKVKDDLESLIKETVYVIKYVEDLKDLISRQVGISKDKVKIEYDYNKNPIGIHVDVDEKIDPITKNKIKMAQQLSRVYVSR